MPIDRRVLPAQSALAGPAHGLPSWYARTGNTQNIHHQNGEGDTIWISRQTAKELTRTFRPTTEMEPASSNGLSLFWDSLPPAVTEMLSKPLDTALVSQRKGRAGRSYSYIEGHSAIDQANRVFGYGGWGYELLGEVG